MALLLLLEAGVVTLKLLTAVYQRHMAQAKTEAQLVEMIRETRSQIAQRTVVSEHLHAEAETLTVSAWRDALGLT